ncbi:MAG: SpoIIIAH-like family protein, partial [Lachnospiraceae bacterium]|nr:SpoIIIAH-like family protein [Lachnospiraceae bacterium]
MITALALMIVIAGYLNFTGKEISDEIMVTNSAQFEESGSGIAITDLSDASPEGGDELAGVYDISDEDLQTYGEIGSLDSEATKEGADYLDRPDAATLAQPADMAAETEKAIAQADEEVFYVSDDPAQLPDQETVSLTAQESETAKSSLVDDVPGEAVFTSTTGITSLESANLLKEQTRAKNKETLMEIISSDAVSEEAKQMAVSSMIAMTDLAEKECATQIMLEAKGFDDVVVSVSQQSVDVMVGMSELTDAQRAQIEDIVVRKTGVKPENIII